MSIYRYTSGLSISPTTQLLRSEYSSLIQVSLNVPMRPPSRPSRLLHQKHFTPSLGVCLALLTLFISVGLFGACVDRYTTADPADPRFRERVREEWRREEDLHHRAVAQYLNQERDFREELKRQEWEREKMKLYWADMRTEEWKCLGSGKRRYTARLANLDPKKSIDGIWACKMMPATIHGITYGSPLECERVCRPFLLFIGHPRA